MLDETRVVWTTEFGRTPYVTSPAGKGREHHNAVFTSWLAGGGSNASTTYGASDDIGRVVAENPAHFHHLHAPILHLLGLQDERPTYRFQGRDFRLTAGRPGGPGPARLRECPGCSAPRQRCCSCSRR